MNDLEINKELAKIAKVKVTQTLGSPDGSWEPKLTLSQTSEEERKGVYRAWDPLHEWGQLGPLVDEYLPNIRAKDWDYQNLKRDFALAVIEVYYE